MGPMPAFDPHSRCLVCGLVGHFNGTRDPHKCLQASAVLIANLVERVGHLENEMDEVRQRLRMR